MSKELFSLRVCQLYNALVFWIHSRRRRCFQKAFTPVIFGTPKKLRRSFTEYGTSDRPNLPFQHAVGLRCFVRMSVPYAPVAWGTEAARRTFGPVGAYMGPYTAGRTVATCDDMGWRRGRACVAFCSAWCSVLVAPLRQWGGALGSGVAWTVLVVWVGVSALRLWAEWPGYDERTTASLHTSLVAATSHTAGRGFRSHRSAPATARSSSPPSTSARRTGFSVSRRCHAAGRLALAVAPRHTGAPHTPAALNCLLCCCLLRAFLAQTFVFLPTHSARSNARHNTCRLSHTPATDLFLDDNIDASSSYLA